MSSELALRGHNELAAPTTIDEAFRIGQIFAQSGLFQDVRGEAQAIVKIMAGAEIGLPPFQSMQAMHIIQGKPTMAANTVAMLIKRSGRYDYRIREWTEQACAIEFMENGESLGTVSFTMQDANKAQLTKNPMWQKYAKSMLFSRAITMGARAHCADIFGGAIYTPEEMGAEVNEEGVPLSLDTSQRISYEIEKMSDDALTDTAKLLRATDREHPQYDAIIAEGKRRRDAAVSANRKKIQPTPAQAVRENAVYEDPEAEMLFSQDMVEGEVVETRKGISDAQLEAVLGYARKIWQEDSVPELLKMLGKSPEFLTQEEAVAAIDRLRHVWKETVPPVVEPPEQAIASIETPKHLKALFAAAHKAKLDSDNQPAMVAAINNFFAGHPTFPQITSRKEVTPTMARALADAIGNGNLKW